jgi:hypothetical protein
MRYLWLSKVAAKIDKISFRFGEGEVHDPPYGIDRSAIGCL